MRRYFLRVQASVTNENFKLGRWKLSDGNIFNAAVGYLMEYFCQFLELALLGQF